MCFTRVHWLIELELASRVVEPRRRHTTTATLFSLISTPSVIFSSCWIFPSFPFVYFWLDFARSTNGRRNRRNAIRSTSIKFIHVFPFLPPPPPRVYSNYIRLSERTATVQIHTSNAFAVSVKFTVLYIWSFPEVRLNKKIKCSCFFFLNIFSEYIFQVNFIFSETKI